MHLPLSDYAIVSTSDVDEAQSILSRELSDLRIKRAAERQHFRLDMNGANLGRTMIGYNRFNTDTFVAPDGVEDVIILAIGVGTPATFYLDGLPVDCSREGAIITPSRKIAIHRPAGSGTLILKARFDAIERRLWELMDRRPGKPIVFDRGVKLDQGVGAQLSLVVSSLVNTLEQQRSTLTNPLLRAGFDDLLLNALLSLPNNFSEELMQQPRRTVAPALVRRTEEFLEAHASEPITISDLVVQFGCSRAALFKAYRRYRDYSPMQFLTEARLKVVREVLQSPASGTTVSTVAYAQGFSHLGRFTAIYRKRYGESPSETLRRASRKNNA